MTRPKWYTTARADALRILVAGERNDMPVYESNVTTDPEDLNARRLTIYWQTRAWLTRQGWILEWHDRVEHRSAYRLTAAGREALVTAGLAA